MTGRRSAAPSRGAQRATSTTVVVVPRGLGVRLDDDLQAGAAVGVVDVAAVEMVGGASDASGEDLAAEESERSELHDCTRGSDCALRSRRVRKRLVKR